MSDSPLIITRRSGWSSAFRFFGCVNLFIIPFCVFYGLVQALPNNPLPQIDLSTLTVIGIINLLGAIHSFFIAFLVDIFADIHWFLSKIASKDT